MKQKNTENVDFMALGTKSTTISWGWENEIAAAFGLAMTRGKGFEKFERFEKWQCILAFFDPFSAVPELL